MFIKSLKTIMVSSVAAIALNAQAALVDIQGTIGACVGLCSVLSASGNSVDATFDTNLAIAPTLTIEGQAGNVITFIGTDYAINSAFMPIGPGLNIPTPAALGVDLSSNADQVAVFGLGATTGAPVWGIFDLVNNTFDSYLFTPDQGDGTPAVLFLADGTFTAVPVPAAAWLMVSGLAGLAGMKRLRK